MSDSIPIFIGYDPREAVCYHVCQQSILDHTEHPVAFYPITGEQRDGSNDFIYARFLVPWRMGWHGHAIFMDGDMIVRGDIADLWALRRSSHIGAQVVKHDYQTKHPVKYLGNRNEDYPRKNWSSVILWNCNFFPNRVLTPDYVSRAPGDYLHRFRWLSDEQIGELPSEWNRLVLEQEVSAEDKLLHYTIGAPCFPEYANCDHAQDWWNSHKRAIEPMR